MEHQENKDDETAEVVLQALEAKSRRVAAESLAMQRAAADERRRMETLPKALNEAVSWGSIAKDGDQTLDFVRHLRAVVKLLRAEGHEPRLDRPGLMPDLARQMLRRLSPEPSESDAVIAELLMRAHRSQDINLSDWMHQRPVPSFDDLPAADRIQYFRDGLDNPPASLWGDLAAIVGIDFDERRCFRRRTEDSTSPVPSTEPSDPDVFELSAMNDVGAASASMAEGIRAASAALSEVIDELCQSSIEQGVGQAFTVTLDGVVFSPEDTAGMRMLAALAAHPRQALTAASLISLSGQGDRGQRRVLPSDLEPGHVKSVDAVGGDDKLDPQAFAEFRSRLKEIAQEKECARREGRMDLIAPLDAERKAIAAQLSGASAASGRIRKLSSDEKKRQDSVWRAFDRLWKDGPPALAAHFKARVTIESRGNRFEPLDGDRPIRVDVPQLGLLLKRPNDK